MSILVLSVSHLPVFILTFNVSDVPPTDVNTTDGSNPSTIASGDLSHVVVNGTGSIMQVTVTVRRDKLVPTSVLS